jgi:folate-dependent phosphoribosylglycinamide formyltransferase PurN
VEFLVISNRRIKNAVFFESPVSLDLYLSQNPTKTLIFAFWSHKVPKAMLDAYQCFGLHIGPLLRGMGKGGSPIENLKANNVKVTTLCAFKMTEGLDDGPVELAIPIYVDNTKEHIINFVDNMLPYITEYLVTPQVPLPERFKRLK